MVPIRNLVTDRLSGKPPSLQTWKNIYIAYLFVFALLLILYLWYRHQLLTDIRSTHEKIKMSEQEIALIQEKINDLQQTLKDMSEFAGREGTMSHTSRIPASSEETEVIRWIDQATKDHALSVSHFEKLQRSQMPLENDDATGEIPKRLIWKTQYKLHLVGTYGDWLAFLKQLEEDAPRLFVATDVDITIFEGKNLLGGRTIFNTNTTVAITLMFDAYDWNETKAR